MKSAAFAFADSVALGRRDEVLDLAERHVSESDEPTSWRQSSADVWTLFENTRQEMPKQGWKLHISATPLSAVPVLEALLPILFELGPSFKIISTLRLLTFLNDAQSSRASSGKFITIYPQDDEQTVLLAEACHRATEGLEGPAILSDRPYRPKGLVHYRYGGFQSDTVYATDGSLQTVIRDPQGQPVKDDREAWFSAPDWVDDPFAAEARETDKASGESPDEIVIAGRFSVIGAIRHSNKGGIYQARDQETGQIVVIKEARPNVGMDSRGRDVVERLRVEHRHLETLGEAGVSPRPLKLVEQEGHLFLAMEAIEGQTLTSLVVNRRRSHGTVLPAEKVRDLILRAAQLLDKAHRAGLVLRDFTPNNLMLLADGQLRLLDPELAWAEGESAPIGVGGGTPGYASPEQLRGEPPAPSDDYYSLGALAYFLATSRDPVLAAEEGSRARSTTARLRGQLELMIRDGFVATGICELVAGGLDAAPERRWSAARVSSFAETMSRETAPQAPSGFSEQATDQEYLTVVRDVVDYCLDCFDFKRASRPLSASCLGEQTDPVNVQYGIAGVGSFLTSALEVARDPGRVRDVVSRAARWTLNSLDCEPPRPLGLYFGKAGAAWFVIEAALALGDEALLEGASKLVLELPTEPPHLDITHGAAGMALTCLRFWEATGVAQFLDHAGALAGFLVANAQSENGQLLWPTPQIDGRGAYYGFAHGSAGIAYAMLAVDSAHGGGTEFLGVALKAAETLKAAARVESGCAIWTHGPGLNARWPHWCNGSSGIGTTLLRVHLVTGDEQYRQLAEQAGRTVMAKKWWFGSSSQCHGPAGNGEFLLDLYQSLGERSFLEMAHELAELLFATQVRRGSRTLFADDSQTTVSPDFSVGAAGVGSFLHRLVRGGARPFMVDSILSAEARATAEKIPA